MTEARLRELFRREMMLFRSVMGGYPVRLYLINRHCPHEGRCYYRDFGYCVCDKPRRSIHFVRRVLGLPRSNIIGLIRHELGHAYDKDVNKPGAEQRADDIAEYVTGHKIYYDKYDVQTIEKGSYPRPLHLHR